MKQPEGSVVLQLLGRARAGDAAARDELFAQCRNYVALIARTQVESWMRTKVDASDLVQQTLLDAHCSFQEFRGGTEGEWLTWLRMILTHNSHDFIRRYKSDKRHVGREVQQSVGQEHDSDFFHDPPGPELTPSQIVIQQERELELADAITQLPDDYREVIILRNLQRLPFEEVALRMNRSGPAVQMLWMRAIRNLQQLMSRSSLADPR